MQPIVSPPVRLRVSVVGLFVDREDVLLIHQMTLPEPDCWDLPGGGMEPHETLSEALRREVQEETGLTDFEIKGLLTVVEHFFSRQDGETRHLLSLVYRCTVPDRSALLSSSDPEVGEKGIQWLPLTSLTIENCSTRTWKVLQMAGLLDGGIEV